MARLPGPIDNGAMEHAALHPDARRRVAMAQRVADAHRALEALHGLEGEVLERVALQMPEIDLEPVRQRRAAWTPA
jgi:hypothetical protein